MIGKLPLNRIISGILTLWLFIRFTTVLFAKHSVQIAIATTSIVFAALIMVTVVNLIKNLSNIKSPAKENKQYNPLADLPINSFNRDILDRKTFVKDLFKQINTYKYKETLTIAIYAGLGEGKTTVLNLLKETIKTSAPNQYIIIDFNPWHYKDENAITQGFFYEFKTSIHRGVFDEAGEALKKYSQILQFGTPKVALHRKLTHIEESLSELTEKINNAIERQNKKIIVLIDEIDRLSKPAILKVFELVQSSAKFRNTIYILSFDVGKVADVLSEEGGINFLEKIVQNSIRLPASEKNTIRQFLYQQIDSILKKNSFDVSERQKIMQRFAYSYESKLETIMKNLRDVKFFLNSFKLSFAPVKTEVNVFDFLILSLIRAFFPNIYSDICTNPEHYIAMDKSQKDFPLVTEISGNPSKLSVKQKTRHIENLLNEQIADENKKNLAANLLLEIFPIKCQNKISKACLKPTISEKQKRICHQKCFARYFMCKAYIKQKKKQVITV